MRHSVTQFNLILILMFVVNVKHRDDCAAIDLRLMQMMREWNEL